MSIVWDHLHLTFLYPKTNAIQNISGAIMAKQEEGQKVGTVALYLPPFLTHHPTNKTGLLPSNDMSLAKDVHQGHFLSIPMHISMTNNVKSCNKSIYWQTGPLLLHLSQAWHAICQSKWGMKKTKACTHAMQAKRSCSLRDNFAFFLCNKNFSLLCQPTLIVNV